MAVSFEPINIESAPHPWRELLTVTRSEVMRPANVGLQAVVRALSPSDHGFHKTPLLVPSSTDRRYFDINPDLRQIKRSGAELGLLWAGIASLILTQGVTRLLDHPEAFAVARDDGWGSSFMRMPVLDQEEVRATCARMVGEKAGQVTDFTVSWRPGAGGELNSGIEVAANIKDGNTDSRSVVLDSSLGGHRGLSIMAKQGSTVEGIPRVRDATPDEIRNMGQSLMLATSLT